MDEETIWSSGLHCVTVLIGAFNLKTGQPIVGVINQPFWKFDSSSKKWHGRKFWGVSTSNQSVSSLTRYPLSRDPKAKKLIISSPSEDTSIKEKLKEDFDFVCSSGAGYKLLCVALGLADIYILSKSTTHFWDTCGPHAILKSLGGGIINYKNILDINTQQREANGKKEGETDFHEANNTGNSSVNNNSRKISSFRQLSYSISDSCKDTHFANVGGLLAYRENQTANVAIQGLLT
ncbi:unnamed protein product [Allacma fusca]|uniref:Inositol polyphosphate 1-phosphatase n=1 Tax=Allacma fusca TaxID=39272 RepID=A0A8J2KTC7_9HEXA|nr:unnamed protein product [Allacma fusca]